MDRWQLVAERTTYMLGTASTREDARGAFVGLAMRFPDGFTIEPLALEQAMRGPSTFGPDFVRFLAKHGVVRKGS